MPDGANVDGPNKASGHFVIELKKEQEFRDLYKRKDSSGKPFLIGDVDKIVNEARHMNFDENLIRFRCGLLSLFDLKNLRWAIFGSYHCFHFDTLLFFDRLLLDR